MNAPVSAWVFWLKNDGIPAIDLQTAVVCLSKSPSQISCKNTLKKQQGVVRPQASSKGKMVGKPFRWRPLRNQPHIHLTIVGIYWGPYPLFPYEFKKSTHLHSEFLDGSPGRRPLCKSTLAFFVSRFRWTYDPPARHLSEVLERLWPGSWNHGWGPNKDIGPL